MECIWCHHRSCLQLSSEQSKVLNTVVRNIIFLCNDCIQRLPTAFECYVSCVQSEPRLLSVELKLSKLQSAEVSLSIAVKKIEAELTNYHKAVSDMLSKDQSSSSAPISATVDSSINPATIFPT